MNVLHHIFLFSFQNRNKEFEILGLSGVGQQKLNKNISLISCRYSSLSQRLHIEFTQKSSFLIRVKVSRVSSESISYSSLEQTKSIQSVYERWYRILRSYTYYFLGSVTASSSSIYWSKKVSLCKPMQPTGWNAALSVQKLLVHEHD